MKLLFSETLPDYQHYVFPYAIWAFPEAGEMPHEFFERGFLPSSKDLERYYLCRSVRVRLESFTPSSENRRILRKGEGVTFKLIPREGFLFTETWKNFCLRYAEAKFGKEVMNEERLEKLFGSKITSHLLIFQDSATGADVGLVTLFLEKPHVAQYYYSFYDLNHQQRSLGMFMMTSAVDFFSKEKWRFIYLGSCYSQNAFYKTQFSGAEFFNGAAWSNNLDELKYLINRTQSPQTSHLFEAQDYLYLFHDGDLARPVESSMFSLRT